MRRDIAALAVASVAVIAAIACSSGDVAIGRDDATSVGPSSSTSNSSSSGGGLCPSMCGVNETCCVEPGDGGFCESKCSPSPCPLQPCKTNDGG